MIKQSDNLSFLGVQCVYTGMYILVCVVHIYIYTCITYNITYPNTSPEGPSYTRHVYV